MIFPLTFLFILIGFSQQRPNLQKRDLAPYNGYYGQALNIQPGQNYGGLFLTLIPNTQQLTVSEDQSVQLTFTLEFNAQLTNHVRTGCNQTQVCTQDVVNILEVNSGLYVSVQSVGNIILGPDPTSFSLQQKYSTMCAPIGPEYQINVNNRNTGCQFPYMNCFGRCGFRKFRPIGGPTNYLSMTNSNVELSNTWQYFELILASPF